MCCAAGCLHPKHVGYFSSPAEYIKWYKRHGPLRDDPTFPTVAVLLYRKHVITEQMYIGQLIGNMEEQGVRPIPIFINGIEAHTVVGTPFTVVNTEFTALLTFQEHHCLLNAEHMTKYSS